MNLELSQIISALLNVSVKKESISPFLGSQSDDAMIASLLDDNIDHQRHSDREASRQDMLSDQREERADDMDEDYNPGKMISYIIFH